MPAMLMPLLMGAGTLAMVPGALDATGNLLGDMGFDPLGRNRRASRGALDEMLGQLYGASDMVRQYGDAEGLEMLLEGLPDDDREMISPMESMLRQSDITRSLAEEDRESLRMMSEQAQVRSGFEESAMRLMDIVMGGVM